MSTAVASDARIVEADLSLVGVLREANGSAGQRKVILDLIVEGFGNQADNHYYGKDLLDRVAHRFEGADMYSDHLTREAEQKLGGLPRTWRDKVGRIRRVWTDVNEAGKRVIRGEAQIFDDQLWRLLEQALDVVGVSINARGTAQQGTAEGRPARVVGDITKVKSVDVVAEAGAGGRILALVEARVAEAIQEGAQMSTRDTTIDDELERDLHEADADESANAAAAAAPARAAAPAAAAAPPAAAAATAPPPAHVENPAHPIEPTDPPPDDPDDVVQRVAREAARAALSEAGIPPGDPIGPLRARKGKPEWDREGYENYKDDELHQGGDPIDTRRPQKGRDTHLRLRGHILEGEDGADDLDPDEIPGLPDDDEADAEVEAYIDEIAEARARELAGQRLYDAVQEAMRVVTSELQARYDEQLAEATSHFEAQVAQVNHRHIAAGMIEAAGLPRATTTHLKSEFYDAEFTSDQALREAVTEAIDQRSQELGTFAAVGARVTGAGDTVLTESQMGERRPGRRGPLRADVDDSIERELAD